MSEHAHIGLVLDCADPDRLASFWAVALGYTHAGTFENFGVLLSPDGAGPKLLLQRVEESKSAKNRMHIDIDSDDIEATAARLEAAGAVRQESEVHDQLGTRWIVMTDPEGNEFCVCDGGSGSTG
jgi:predicted enzyme related to lactoylglutathione lyase